MNEDALALAEVSGRIRGRGRNPEDLLSRARWDKQLTSEQRAIVGAPLGASLVVAGAGSGKTETLALRFVYLLDHGRDLFGRDLAPDEILCLTFTRKAAAEIADRVEQHLDAVFGPEGNRPPPAVSTYNAYAAGLVAEHGLRVGVDPDSAVLTEASRWQWAARVAEAWEDALDYDGTLDKAAEAIAGLASGLADHRVDPERLSGFLSELVDGIGALPRAPKARGDSVRDDLLAPLKKRLALVPLVERYIGLKRESKVHDFSDQIAFACRLSELAPVQEVERSRFHAVLLDEFQDTSPGQLDLLLTLFGDGHPVMAVGDPFQAIYGFRGASEAALERFADELGVRGEPLTLSVSWRNCAGILAAANAVTSPLREASTIGVPLLRTRFEEKGANEPPEAIPAVTARLYRDDESEAAGLISLLAERREALLRAHSPGEDVECAVLVRVRSQMPAIVRALKDAGLDYQVSGIGGVLDVPVVVDLVALLETAHDPARGDSLMRLLAGGRVALGIGDIAAVGEWAEHLAGPRDQRETDPSLVEAVDSLPPTSWTSPTGRSLSDEARRRLEELNYAIADVRSHAYLPLPDLIVHASRVWTLDIEARMSQDGGDIALRALVDASRSFSQGTETATLGGFLAWLEAARDYERGLDTPDEEPRKGAIQVMTLHSAKGMEWDLVAIPGLVDGVFPSVDPSGDADAPTYKSGAWISDQKALPWPLRRDGDRLPQWEWTKADDAGECRRLQDVFRIAAGRHELEEERRLFYVALTRARSGVILSAVPRPKAKRIRPVSVFLKDLETASVVDVEPVEPIVASEDGGRRSDPAVWPTPVSPAESNRRALAHEIWDALTAPEESSDLELPHRADIDALLAEATVERKEVVDLPTHLSSTDLVALAKDRDAWATARRRPMPRNPGIGARRGEAFHAWVERHFRTPALLDPEDEWDGSSEHESPGRSDLEELKARFLEGEWAQRKPEAVELGLELPIGDLIVRSRIDAVFPPRGGGDRWTVVDWKTGDPPRDPAEKAFRDIQLAVYRQGWAALNGLDVDQVDAVFVYVRTGETVRPSRFIDLNELREIIRGG